MNMCEMMMRCIVAIALATLVLSAPATSRAQEESVTTVAGGVTWVGTEAVEVNGRRALVTQETTITSEGRSVSLASVRVGMPAELEMDDGGRAIELRVTGAVE
jgi:hypothetical protein